jgi:predicted P-loop ATPase
MVGAVKRVFEPGCKFDHMLILEGGQGKGKSTFFQDLANFGPYGEYFCDTFQLARSDSKDELAKLSGVLIVEVQEMANFNRKDRDTLTAFVTTKIDEYRKPYGRLNHKYPRQFVLAGTYNPTGGLFSDPTGARRYWCVTVDTIDNARLRDDQNQLWAEAVHLYRSGYQLALSPDIYALAEKAQRGRYMDDPWSTEVLTYAYGKGEVQIKDIMSLLDIPKHQRSGRDQGRIVKILKHNRFTRTVKHIDNVPIPMWLAPGYDPDGPKPKPYDDVAEEIDF